MLTDEVKIRIREEELFREEIRKEIERQRSKPKTQKFWEFLNSAFAIWLLSTVLVGLATWGYTRWREGQLHQRALDQALGMSKTEIGYRLSNFLQLLDYKVGTALSYNDALQILDGSPDRAPEGYSAGFFPQLRSFPLNLLYDQLSELIGAADQEKLDGLGKFQSAHVRLLGLQPPQSGPSEAWKVMIRKTIEEAFSGLHAATPILPGWKSAWPVYAGELGGAPASDYTGTTSPNLRPGRQ